MYSLVLQFEDVADILTCLFGDKYEFVFYFNQTSVGCGERQFSSGGLVAQLDVGRLKEKVLFISINFYF